MLTFMWTLLILYLDWTPTKLNRNLFFLLGLTSLFVDPHKLVLFSLHALPLRFKLVFLMSFISYVNP